MNGIIYKAENLITYKSYIGQTIKPLETRKYNHYSLPEKVKTYFHKALLKYPKEYWIWNAECNIEAPTQILLKEYLNIAENMFIEQENTLVPNGYNLTLGGEGILGYHHSVKTKEKIRDSEKGKFVGEITLKKMSDVNKGKRLSQEIKQKISKALSGEKNPNYGKHLSGAMKQRISQTLQGRHHSEEAKQKMSESKKGHFASIETRRKMSEAQRGKNHPMYGKHHSEETKRKMSEAHKGHFVSKAIREKLSKARETYIITQETRQKISQTLKKYWEKNENI